MHKGVKGLDYIKADGNVVFEIEKNNFGLTLFGRRNGEPDSYYWRITQWLVPLVHADSTIWPSRIRWTYLGANR